MKRAIFLDRDGVINKLIFNPKTREYGAPLNERDLKFYPWAHKVLKKLQDIGYLLFLVSNQPDYAKGYASLKNIKSVHAGLRRYFTQKGIRFRGYFYCFHHPEGRVAKYRLNCACRKPKAYFVRKAQKQYSLNMGESWFIGDSDSDIFCGQAAGLKTISLEERHSRHKRGRSHPDFAASNLKEALRIIIPGS